jgi:hypothetical protein
MSRTGDYPPDREGIWARHLVYSGEHKWGTLVDCATTCPTLQFGGLDWTDIIIIIIIIIISFPFIIYRCSTIDLEFVIKIQYYLSYLTS